MKLLKAVLVGTSLTHHLINGVSGLASSVQSKNKKTSTCLTKDDVDRRGVLKAFTVLVGSSVVGSSLFPAASVAEIYDDTASMSNTNSDSAYSPKNLGLNEVTGSSKSMLQSNSGASSSNFEPSDEVKLSIPKSKLANSSLGIQLSDVEFRTNRRVYVKSIAPNSLASAFAIRENWILVSVNGQSTERTNAQGAAMMVSQILKSPKTDSLDLVFRDATKFQSQLNSLTAMEGNTVTTQVAPAGDTTQRNQDGSVKLGYGEREQEDQKLSVSQLVAPRLCRRGATTDDLLEISYIGSVAETGNIFDGSAVKINGESIPGR